MRLILPAGVARLPAKAGLLRAVESLPMDEGYIVTILQADKVRSNAQNNLQRLWHLEASAQLGDESPEEKRAYCKLHFGVPILRAENDEFKAEYDRVIRPMPYETKLSLMRVPFDFPVTRLMTKKQKTKFLDAMYHHYTSLGVRLTYPDDQGR
jgi:hypothetical protein